MMLKSSLAVTADPDERRLSLLNEEPADADLYLQRLAFVEYMSDPATLKSAPHLRELATVLSVPYATLLRWKRSQPFQLLVAKRARDSALGGLGLALAYQQLMNIISDTNVPLENRQKAATDLAKLDLKRESMYLSFKLQREKAKGKTDRGSFEDAVLEAEYEVLPND